MLTVTGINLVDEDEGEQLSLFGGMSADVQTSPLSMANSSGQFSLFSETAKSGQIPPVHNAVTSREKSESVERTMDEIRRKFGNKSIKFGRVIGNDIGVDL